LVLNTIFNTLAQLVSLVSVFFFTPLLVKDFGQTQYGLYILAGSVVAYAAIFDFGIGTALIRNVAEADALDDNEKLHEDIQSALVINLAIGALVALVMFVLGVYVQTLFKISPAHAYSLRWLLWINGGVQFFYWPLSTARLVLSGLKRYRSVATTSVFIVVGTMTSMAFVVIAHEGLIVLSLLAGFMLLAGHARNAVLVIKSLPPVRAGRSVVSFHKVSTATIKGMLIAGVPLFVIQLTSALMRDQTDKVILGVMVGGAAVALYEVGSKCSFLVSYLISLMCSAVLPVITNLEAQNRKDDSRNFFARGTRYIAIVTLPVAVALFLLSRHFIVTWMGPGYGDSVLILRLLIGSQILMPFYILGDSLLIARKKYSYWIKVSVIVALLNVGLSVLFVYRYGIWGVALGTLAANLVDFPLRGSYVIREAGLKLRTWIEVCMWPAVPALLLLVGCYWVLVRTTLFATLLGVVAGFGIMVAVYWAFMYIVGLKPWERQQAIGFARRLLRGVGRS